MQSYKTKFCELKVLLKETNPCCVCLQETLLVGQPMLPPSGYTLVRSDPVRNDGHERGTAILVNKYINYETIELNTDIQATAVKIWLGKWYSICTIYLPHIEVTRQSLSQLIEQLEPPFLLVGDMNAKHPLWGEPVPNQKGHIFEQLMLEYRMSIMNDGAPTHYHIQTNSSSIIDLSICSSDCLLDFQYEVLESLHGSDHYPIKLSLSSPQNINERPPRFLTSKADWKLFRDTTKTDVNPAAIQNVDELVDTVENIIMNAADASIPQSSGNCRRPPVPWWSAECQRAYNDRLKAERKMKRNHTVENKIAYNRTKARCRLILNNSKKESWIQYVSSINQRASLSKIWKRVQKISGKYKSTPSPILKNDDNTLVHHPLDVANKLANAFASVSKPENFSREFLRYKQISETQHINFYSNENCSYNQHFTDKELDHCISITNETSPGADRVTYSMLKHIHPSLKTIILQTFNRIYQENFFPQSWRTAIVVAIPKPGKDHSNPLNYRPISLTSCLCKILEKMVNIRLMWYLESNGCISKIQSGFRQNRSTTDHLTALENDLRVAMNQKLHTIAVFFDLTKAYDMAWKYGIVRNLYQYGLRGNLPNFIRNFLMDRSIRVRIGKVLSDSVMLSEGTPQGSVLSCTCFMIAIDGITRCLTDTVKGTLYVDDFTIYASGALTHTIERRLQVVINRLIKWTQETGFIFSPMKTVSMHICRKHNCGKTAHNLTIDNSNIRCVDEYKFLGLTFDNSLRWNIHIKQLKTSCVKTLDLLKHISFKKWGADKTSLLRLYIMLIKPKIDYGSEAYSSACKSILESINPIQNTAIRIATGAFKSSPVLSLQAISGIKPISTYRHIKLLNYQSRIYANPEHPMHNLLELRDNNNDPAPVYHNVIDRARHITSLYNLDITNIMEEAPMTVPPWTVNNIFTCTDLYQFRKSELEPHQMRALFLNHVRSHDGSYCIYTDGSKTEDGVGYAYVAGRTIFSKRIESYATIFTAELLALHDSLIHCRNVPNPSITLITDSRSSIQAIKRYNSNNPIIKEIQCLIKNLNKPVHLCWVPSHVGVEGNEMADTHAGDVVGNSDIQLCKIPRLDFKCHIKQVCTNAWKTEWRDTINNKYREISEFITPPIGSSSPDREWERALTRLRIGHSKLTHGFLMDGTPQTVCDRCFVPLSMKHILIECYKYSNERRRTFGNVNLTMKTLLIENDTSVGGPLYRYIRSIGILEML